MKKFGITGIILSLNLSGYNFAYAHVISDNEKLKDLENQYLAQNYQHQPEMMEEIQAPNARHDVFNNHSLKFADTWNQVQEDNLKTLYQIDDKNLVGNSLSEYRILREHLEAAHNLQICRQELWHLDSMFPWFAALANLAQIQPVGDEKARNDALKRWKTFDSIVNDEINNLKAGLKQGYSTSKAVLPRIIGQLDSLLSTPIKDSPFFVPGIRDLDAQFQKDFTEIMNTIINPGLKKFRDFLAQEYMQSARSSLGVGDLPHGMECYKAMVRSHTTVNISPEKIRDLGFKAITNLSTELEKISEKYFNNLPITELLQLAATKQYPFSSEQDMLDYNYKALERAKAALPKLMSVTPTSAFEIHPYPEFRAKAGAVGEYHLPSEDGKNPGIFYINTFGYDKVGYADQESTLFHEGIPGHHLQLALIVENKNLHSISKIIANNAIIEGWALYAEQLAYEYDLFSDPLAKVGYISNALLRASRLVIDTGLHVFNWSKEDAINFMRTHTSLDELKINSEVDRYITYGGQATSYYIGLTAILEARENEKQRLGDKYSIIGFHDRILTQGLLPLSYL